MNRNILTERMRKTVKEHTGYTMDVGSAILGFFNSADSAKSCGAELKISGVECLVSGSQITVVV